MQVCKVCGLLFLGGGACPTCGSQVAEDLAVDDFGGFDEEIPGLEEMADAIGGTQENESSQNALPFGIGARTEVLKSSLPFGVGSPTYKQEFVQDSLSEEQVEPDSFTPSPEIETADITPDNYENNEAEFAVIPEEKTTQSETTIQANTVAQNEPNVSHIERLAEKQEIPVGNQQIDTVIAVENPIIEEEKYVPEIEASPQISSDIPDIWRIDAAEVDMEEIYSQSEEIIEVNFDNESLNSDVEVKFDDLHYEPEEVSMASEDDSPELHPAQALPVETSGEPELASMIETAFDYMSQGSWVEASQILSTASANRQNDSSILNNLGLTLLQSALEMDSRGDPMSSSQYEAAIMALRQSAKLDPDNNTVLLNLSQALLVSGRAEKSLGVLSVIRQRIPQNAEIANTMGACMVQLGREIEAREYYSPFSTDEIVSRNLALLQI